MTFLNPLLLIALVAVIIPIIIHLLNFRKATKIEFSTLMFLKEVKEKEIHKIKIKELILLLIRILIITFLILSFSKPLLKSESYGESTKSKTAIILLDNSFSMDVYQEGRRLIDFERDILNSIKSNFHPTDNIIVINSDFQIAQGNTSDSNIFNITYTPFNIPSLLEKSESLLKEQSGNYVEIFIISDFQKNNFNSNNFHIEQNSSLKNSHFYFIPVLKHQTSNLGIQTIENLSQINDIYTESKFRVNIKNYNNNDVLNKKLNVYYNDSLIFEKYLSFKPLETQTVNFNLKPNRTDLFYVFADLLNIDNSYDDIKEDNKFYYTTNIPEKIKVFILSDNEKYSEYLVLAFKSINTVQGNEIIFYDQSNKLNKDLSDYDVLVINGKSSFTSEEINKISDYHKSGGGILFFPTINSDIENNNKLLQEISKSKIQNLVNVYDKEEIRLRFSEFNHYITEGIYKFKNTTNNELTLKETPSISKYFTYTDKELITPIIKINDGDFLIGEFRDANSPVLFYSISADLLMSDFPVKDIFPVLIIKSVYYLSYKNYSYNLISGKSGIIFNKSNYDFIKNLENNIVNSKRINKGFVSITATNELNKPGVYFLSDSSGKNKQYFTVNIDTTESNIIYANEKDINEISESYGIEKVSFIDNTEFISEILLKNRNGIDLTNLFLYLSIIFIVIEILFVNLFFKK